MKLKIDGRVRDMTDASGCGLDASQRYPENTYSDGYVFVWRASWKKGVAKHWILTIDDAQSGSLESTWPNTLAHFRQVCKSVEQKVVAKPTVRIFHFWNQSKNALKYEIFVITENKFKKNVLCALENVRITWNTRANKPGKKRCREWTPTIWPCN